MKSDMSFCVSNSDVIIILFSAPVSQKNTHNLKKKKKHTQSLMPNVWREERSTERHTKESA